MEQLERAAIPPTSCCQSMKTELIMELDRTDSIMNCARKKKLRTRQFNFASPIASAGLTAAIFTVCGNFVPSLALAEGFRNPPPGTQNLGRAGARAAHIDDASSIAHNPANLLDVPTAEVQFAPTLVFIEAEYTSVAGVKAETKEPWKILPNLFASIPIQDGRLAFGLGITTPYGVGNEWKPTGAFGPGGNLRYTSAFSAELKTINFNPSFAFRLHDRLQVGLGVDVFWSQLTLKQFYPWLLVSGNPTDPDGVAKAQGDGFGAGGNLGITWEFADRQRLAFTVKTPVSVNYSGDFTLNNVPAGLGGGTLKSDFYSGIDFPTIVGLGYGIQLTDTIRVGADLEWIEFSRFDDLPLDVETPAPGLPSSVREDWNDTFTIGVGGDWKFSPNWIARASYQFYESPVPDRTFSPVIPDAHQNVFTVGLGYAYKRHHLEAAYGLDFYNERNIRNNQQPAFNGDYSLNVHLFSFTYRLNF